MFITTYSKKTSPPKNKHSSSWNSFNFGVCVCVFSYINRFLASPYKVAWGDEPVAVAVEAPVGPPFGLRMGNFRKRHVTYTCYIISYIHVTYSLRYWYLNMYVVTNICMYIYICSIYIYIYVHDILYHHFDINMGSGECSYRSWTY